MDRRVKRALAFFMVVVTASLIALTVQISRRNEAIDQLHAAATRIESAATHTEEVLVEVVQARQAPEAIAQNERVREALNEISQIKAILCDTVTHEVCDEPDE